MRAWTFSASVQLSAAPGGAAEPQRQVVQGGGQLPSDMGVGQGRAASKPGQAPACWLPDMLVVAAEGLVDVDKVLGILQIGLLAGLSPMVIFSTFLRIRHIC